MRAVSRICHENIESEQNENKKRKQMKQDEHQGNDSTKCGNYQSERKTLCLQNFANILGFAQKFKP